MEQYYRSNVKEFVEWYKKYDRKTRITFNDTYGGNVSTLKMLGNGSYEIELGTYSPTDLVSGEQWTSLASDTFRDIRARKDTLNSY
jgi:hypothetical protein